MQHFDLLIKVKTTTVNKKLLQEYSNLLGCCSKIKYWRWITWYERVGSFQTFVYMCHNANETILHLFSQYQTTVQIVQEIHFAPCQYFSQREYSLATLEAQHRSIKEMQITICFVIWREWCRRVFAQNQKTLPMVAKEIIEDISSWFLS